MHYISTRALADQAPADFEQVLLAGLARDGGLYVPVAWPEFSAEELKSLQGRSFGAVTAAVVSKFAGDGFARAEIEGIAEAAYAGFAHAATAPLVQIAPDRWVMELFHGPTLAFKDFALQYLGRLFDAVLLKRGVKRTVVGATSGDTGSAAIEACKGRDNLSIVILHPEGRVSDVQRLQMTTVDAANVHNLAIAGTFDDCQALVKALFNDLEYRDSVGLAAVNSINWVRVAVQVSYYVYAALALGAASRPVSFSVPSGNFGNVFAGYAAKRMGVPIGKLIVATNKNDILARFFETGTYAMEGVHPTLSPSMDIEVSSNFERLLFELCGRDGGVVGEKMAALAGQRRFSVSKEQLARARQDFTSHRTDDEACLATISALWRETGQIIDPHTAAGVAAARAYEGEGPVVSLATAHAAKFPDAVERAIGVRPALPPRLADLMGRPEHVTRMANNLAAVKAFVRAHAAGTKQGTKQECVA